jgi:hypothetical protein
MFCWAHWGVRGGPLATPPPPPFGGLEGGGVPPFPGGHREVDPLCPGGLQGGGIPPARVFMDNALNFFLLIFVSIFGWFFVDGFLFSVKELGLLTNPGYWVRVLDAM